MTLKKANAAFGLLTIVMLLVHVGYQMYAYINFVYAPEVTKLLGDLVMLCLIVHMVLGMSIMMFANDGTELKKYPKENKGTIIQRASAIGTLVFLFGHLKAYSILTSHVGGIWSFILAMLIQVLFFGCVFMHVATSFSKAFITLGWLESMDTKKKIDKVVWAISIIAFIAVIVVIGRTSYALWSM